MAFFSSDVFSDAFEHGIQDGVGPSAPVVPPKRGIPINAYKQFKFIDRFGNTYYMKPQGFDHNGY